MNEAYATSPVKPDLVQQKNSKERLINKRLKARKNKTSISQIPPFLLLKEKQQQISFITVICKAEKPRGDLVFHRSLFASTGVSRVWFFHNFFFFNGFVYFSARSARKDNSSPLVPICFMWQFRLQWALFSKCEQRLLQRWVRRSHTALSPPHPLFHALFTLQSNNKWKHVTWVQLWARRNLLHKHSQ